MPAWQAALVAVWKVLEPYLGPVLYALFGAKLQRGSDAEDTMEKVMDASKAVAASRGWSHADRVRFLKERGLYRVLPKREGNQQQ